MHAVDDGVLTATVGYRDGGRSWQQRFRAARLALPALEEQLEAAELRSLGSPAPSWLLAQRQR